MKYYAAINAYSTESSIGFSNTWDVLVFNSKSARDDYVNNSTALATRAIKKSEVTSYAANYNCTFNKVIKPRPFTEEFWGIDNDQKQIPGYLGYVRVCYPGDGVRLYG